MRLQILAACCLANGYGSLPAANAADRHVGDDAEFAAALNSAEPGDRILLAPGIYRGGISHRGLDGVTISSQQPGNRAVIDAGGVGQALHLSSATNVVIENLILRNYFNNGVNIDDGGDWPAGKSSHITLRNLEITNETAPPGNRDGVKLSGVDHFVIDRL
ncbi:MAG: hypothetical protein AAF961_12680, partial [Planctomycetota bacterium]